jgi:uncharacterized protein YfdQ (DUF2303 family)
MSHDHSTEADAVAEMALAAAHEPQIITSDAGRQFLVYPNGLGSMSYTDVTEDNAVATQLPDHITQGVTLQTTDSLIDYIDTFKTPETVLFADIDTNSMVAAIDYHDPSTTREAQAGSVSHLATMVLPHALEWKLWTSISGRLMGQLEFARFLEENSGDISAPSGADVLEACRDLQAKRSVNFIKAVRTSTDNENFEFTDETVAKTKGGLELPAKFTLRIPVYFDGEVVTVEAMLRWKVEDNNLQLGIALHRAEQVRQAVFKAVVGDVAARTERPAMFGKMTASR